MTEDVKAEIAQNVAALQEEVEVPVVEIEVEESVEDKARAVGWRPDGPDSAEVFLRTKPLYDAIKTRGKEAQELKATVKQLQDHMAKLEAVAYKKALAELKAERRAAISAGDVSAVEQFDKAIEEIKPVEIAPVADEHAKAFVERNASWINDPSMEAEEQRQWVKAEDERLAKYNLSPDVHIAELEKAMHKKFPKQEDAKAPHVARVESERDSASVKGKRKISFNDLSKEQKDACRHFEKRGIMKADEYIKQLQELGEI